MQNGRESEAAEIGTMSTAQALLSQRGREILSRRPPLLMGTDSAAYPIEQTEAGLPHSDTSYVVELPAEELESVSQLKPQGGRRRFRHTLMVASTAILMGIGAIVLLASDVGDGRGSDILLSQTSSIVTVKARAVSSSTTKQPSVVAFLEKSKATHKSAATGVKSSVKENVKDAMKKRAAKKIAIKAASQTTAKTAKKLHDAAAAKAGADLFARAVRSTEKAMAQPSSAIAGVPRVNYAMTPATGQGGYPRSAATQYSVPYSPYARQPYSPYQPSVGGYKMGNYRQTQRPIIRPYAYQAPGYPQAMPQYPSEQPQYPVAYAYNPNTYPANNAFQPTGPIPQQQQQQQFFPTQQALSSAPINPAPYQYQYRVQQQEAPAGYTQQSAAVPYTQQPSAAMPAASPSNPAMSQLSSSRSPPARPLRPYSPRTRPTNAAASTAIAAATAATAAAGAQGDFNNPPPSPASAQQQATASKGAWNYPPQQYAQPPQQEYAQPQYAQPPPQEYAQLPAAGLGAGAPLAAYAQGYAVPLQPAQGLAAAPQPAGAAGAVPTPALSAGPAQADVPSAQMMAPPLSLPLPGAQQQQLEGTVAQGSAAGPQLALPLLPPMQQQPQLVAPSAVVPGVGAQGMQGSGPMLVDGARADTLSLQQQAAASASRTLGASLGSDSPYLSSLRQQLQQEMLKNEEGTVGIAAAPTGAAPLPAAAAAAAAGGQGSVEEAANPYLTRMGFMGN